MITVFLRLTYFAKAVFSERPFLALPFPGRASYQHRALFCSVWKDLC